MTAFGGMQLRFTGHSKQGDRKYMEDCFIVSYQPKEDARGRASNDNMEYSYFGVFDGHGGFEAAKFAKEHLMGAIVGERNFWSDRDEDVLKAIRDGFINTHMAMWNEQHKWPKTASGLPSTAGTTASVAFLRHGKIYTGHVGDSGIVLGYQQPGSSVWEAQRLTKDHKPDSPIELARIKQCGGKVMSKSGVPRVVWYRPQLGHKGPITRNTPFDEIPFLAVARSLGDLWSYNSANNEFIVSPEPDTYVIPIDMTTFRCLVFGSDGLWNMVTPSAAVNLVQAAEQSNAMSILNNGPRINPSINLVERALERWSNSRMRADNTTVVTLILDPKPQTRCSMSETLQPQLQFLNKTSIEDSNFFNADSTQNVASLFSPTMTEDTELLHSNQSTIQINVVSSSSDGNKTEEKKIECCQQLRTLFPETYGMKLEKHLQMTEKNHKTNSKISRMTCSSPKMSSHLLCSQSVGLGTLYSCNTVAEKKKISKSGNDNIKNLRLLRSRSLEPEVSLSIRDSVSYGNSKFINENSKENFRMSRSRSVGPEFSRITRSKSGSHSYLSTPHHQLCSNAVESSEAKTLGLPIGPDENDIKNYKILESKFPQFQSQPTRTRSIVNLYSGNSQRQLRSQSVGPEQVCFVTTRRTTKLGESDKENTRLSRSRSEGPELPWTSRSKSLVCLCKSVPKQRLSTQSLKCCVICKDSFQNMKYAISEYEGNKENTSKKYEETSNAESVISTCRTDKLHCTTLSDTSTTMCKCSVCCNSDELPKTLKRGGCEIKLVVSSATRERSRKREHNYNLEENIPVKLKRNRSLKPVKPDMTPLMNKIEKPTRTMGSRYKRELNRSSVVKKSNNGGMRKLKERNVISDKQQIEMLLSDSSGKRPRGRPCTIKNYREKSLTVEEQPDADLLSDLGERRRRGRPCKVFQIRCTTVNNTERNIATSEGNTNPGGRRPRSRRCKTRQQRRSTRN